MRTRNLIAAAAILSLSGAGFFHEAQAITSCEDSGLCSEFAATAQAVAPNIIPWDQIWALDSKTPAPDQVRKVQGNVYGTVDDAVAGAEYRAQQVRSEIGRQLGDVPYVGDLIPARDVQGPTAGAAAQKAYQAAESVRQNLPTTRNFS